MLYEVRFVAGNERGCGLVYTSHLFYTTHTGRKQTTQLQNLNVQLKNSLYCTHSLYFSSMKDSNISFIGRDYIYSVLYLKCVFVLLQHVILIVLKRWLEREMWSFPGLSLQCLSAAIS